MPLLLHSKALEGRQRISYSGSCGPTILMMAFPEAQLFQSAEAASGFYLGSQKITQASLCSFVFIAQGPDVVPFPICHSSLCGKKDFCFHYYQDL